MSENKQSGNPNERQPVAKVSILPLIKKYFKTVGALVGVWCVGYFRFSATWMLIPPFFYILNEEYRKSKETHKRFAKEAAVDEKSAVLSRIDELPSWVFFPDVERAEWLNKMIKQMWPYIGEYVKGILKTSVEGQISNSLPSSMQPFRFEKIDLGDAPPRIGGVKVYIDNIPRDEIIMDLEIFLASDTNIKVCLRGMNAGIKDLMIHGQLRVVMKLCNKMPIIGGLNVFFLNQPNVDFDLTNYANLLDMPLLSNSLRSVIQDQLNYYLVLPNKIPIQLVDSIDLQRLHYPIPQGVLRLHMMAGRELKRADFKLVGKGKSDPYCKIYIGAQYYKTKVIENTINPVWNNYFESVVDQKQGQFAEIEVLDKDPGGDDELGTASIDISNVAEHGSVDTWLPLENVETGMVHIRALWLHLSKNPEDLDKESELRRERETGHSSCGGCEDWLKQAPSNARAGDSATRRVHIVDTLLTAVQSNQEQETQSVTEDQLSSALLIVNLDSAKSLPRSKKSMSEPSPYVKLSLGNTVQKSVPKNKTTDPKWEENFQFLVYDPRNQDLLVEVYDSSHKKKVLDSGNKEKRLGVLTVSLKSLLSMPDMTVNRPYQLKEAGPQSKLNLRIVLRILNSEKLPNFIDEEHDIKEGETETPDPLPEKKPIEAEVPAKEKSKNNAPEAGNAPEEKVRQVQPASGQLQSDVLTSELPAEWAQDNPPIAPVEPKEKAAETKPADTKTADTKPAAKKTEEAKPAPAKSSPPKSEPAAAPVKESAPKPSASGVEDIIPVMAQETEAAEFMIGGDPDTISNASSTLERAGSELRQRNIGGSSDMGLGRMQLTLRYSSQRSRLIVVVHKCVNLIPCDDDNLADPYIRIYLLPDKSSGSKRKTQVIKNNLQPIFDETFEWSLPLNEVKQRTLDIQVKNKNSMFSKARVHMGQVVINLADLDLTKASTEWYDLDDPAEDTFKDD